MQALDLNDLLAFVRVVEEGSFTKAARTMEQPKSTVSRKVARLEEQLGVRLLQRSTRQLAITDAGTRLFEHGSRIAHELEEAELAVTQMHEKPSGLLKITAPVEFGNMPLILAPFMETYPDIQVSLHLSNQYVDLVSEGIDVAIRAGKTLADPALIARKLRNSTMKIVGSPNYFEKYGFPQDPYQLSDHNCILFPQFAKRAIWTLKWQGELIKIPVSGRLGTNHLDSAKNAALADLGLARIPGEFCKQELEDGVLQEVLPGCDLYHSSIWVVYPENRYPSPKVRAFVDFMVEIGLNDLE